MAGVGDHRSARISKGAEPVKDGLVETDLGGERGVRMQRVVIPAQAIEQGLGGCDLLAHFEIGVAVWGRRSRGPRRARPAEAAILEQ